MIYNTRNEFFNALGGLKINEIRDELLLHTQNKRIKYNELVNDFEDHINGYIGACSGLSTAKTEKEFADHKAQELQPLTRGEIWEYEEFGWWDRNLVFDYITIEPNGVKLSCLKVSCDYDDVERINKYVYWAFKFREACKLIISELLSKPARAEPEPEPLDLSDTSAVEKIIYLNELGIIDFLRAKPEFKGSVNLMATFLSSVTGVKPTTLQTSINKLINNDTDDKNHPYRTQKTVEKIKQTFINKNVKPKTS
jgi:hypothetical protein